MRLLLDTYSLLTRVGVAGIVFLPPLLVLAYHFPELRVYNHESGFEALLLSSSVLGVIMFLVGALVRSHCRKGEKGLIEKLGGWPTSVLLRHSDWRLDPHTKRRYHHTLTELLPSVKMPIADEEMEDTKEADKVYSAHIRRLRALTRDKSRYPLVFKELTNYGFARNLYLCRTNALLLLGGSLILHTRLVWRGTGLSVVTVTDWGVYGFLSVLVMLWVFFIDVEFVKGPAYDYAERLLETLDIMDVPQKS